MVTVTLHTPDGVQSVQVVTGTRLADIQTEQGQSIVRPCGGVGRCGQCRVRAVGSLSPITEKECNHLTEEERADGIRLACCTFVTGDAQIWWEEETSLTHIMTDSHCDVEVVRPLFIRLGAAIDIGTTTIAARLYDESGRLATAAAPNSQSRYGADVISRISYALGGGAEALSACVRADVNGLLGRLCRQVGRKTEELDGLVVTGNTAMLYLLTGESVAPLAAAPFAITEVYGRLVSPAGWGWDVREDLPVYLPRCMTAFVGADITTAQLASGLCDSTGPALLADIGTNGELTLWQGGTLSVCSTAAGPAFEAANLSCGKQGVNGAVDRVWIEGNTLGIHTIDEGTPVGICGSGVTDLVACLLHTGRLDETGYLEEGAVTLAPGVFFTQEDVRQVQLAKSAIRSGLETLLHTAGVAHEQVKRFAVAGGFGSYMSPDSAAAIGLIPPSLRNLCESIGNAALTGAAMMLCDRGQIKKGDELAKKARHVELATDGYFSEQYIEQMMFG